MNLGSETNIMYIVPYVGRTFKTDNKSNYTLTPDGKISGRASIEGADIKYVVGVAYNIAEDLKKCLTPSVPKSEFDKMIQEHGQEPREGLCLVVSLTSRSAEEKNRKGIVTSVIIGVDPPLH